MQPLAHTLWQRKKREKERKFNINSKNTASSCKQYYYILEYLVFFLEEPSHHKKQKRGGGNWRSCTTYYRCTWYAYHIKDALDSHEQTGGGPAAKGRDKEGQMRRSYVCFFGLVATCDIPGTTCVIHVQKFHPTRVVCCFILTWGGVWCRFLVLLLNTPA